MSSKKPKIRFAAESREAKAAVEQLAAVHRLRLDHEESSVYGLLLTYRNEVAGLQLEFSPPEGRGWSGVIARLVAGKFPKHPIYIGGDTHLDRFDVRDLGVERISRVPNVAAKLERMEPLNVAEVVEIVQCCGSEVLQGDFAVFAQLRKHVMARVERFEAERLSCNGGGAQNEA
ncbi:hypothetical protein [Ideonella alba]|uniref:Uncharacterized protein n=1 Tax=Ideonella alba TaxID=2824118 RepID=A0A941BJB9_9BURK|nr:hypothetical protein [Ideonella alba]MBQ0933663.1 hypothetical protein [Ideonella alba]